MYMEPEKKLFQEKTSRNVWIFQKIAVILPRFFRKGEKAIVLTLKNRVMNQYETVFILTPVLSDAQMKEAVEKFKGILVAEGAEIINEENWGMKKLAYPIEKKTTGFYQLLEFKAEPTVIEKLEVNFRRDERVIRYLTVKMEKYAAQYAEKRRSLKQSKSEEA